jgi:archaemetzincin
MPLSAESWVHAVLLAAACGVDGAAAAAPAPASDPASAAAPTEPVTGPVARPRTRGTVVLVPLGEDVPADVLDDVERGLRAELEVDVERRDPVPLPAEAYYAPRRRWRAEKLLAHLHEVVGDPDARVLGLTSADISTTNGPHRDWGIFGLGELPGRTCVVSTFRLARKPRDRAHFLFRVRSTAVHEVGHTFGLDHCGEERCVMQDAEGSIANTDAGDGRLAAGCRAELQREAPLAP